MKSNIFPCKLVHVKALDNMIKTFFTYISFKIFCIVVKMAEETKTKEWKDWIGELFTPSYDVTVDDILGGNHEEKSTIKSKVKLVSALDPDTVKEVYERVRVTCVLAEEMRNKETATDIKETKSKGL